MNKNTILKLLLAGSLLAQGLLAQAGSGVTGKIIDSSTGEPLFGATVIVRSISKYTRTDSDGNYRLDLPSGKHDVEFIMFGFDTQKKSINVTAGYAKYDIIFGLKALETVDVIDKARVNSEAGLLASQKKSASVSDGITAESISKSPDSSAGDVMRRVTGITLIEGKYIFVRGLGEKYSNTLLNDVMIPSTEPDKRVIPLDIFPASVLKNITVDKTFLPENPGNFSGGLVKVNTKEYPDSFEMKVGLGLGQNQITTGKEFKSMKEYEGDKYGRMSNGRTPSFVSSYPNEIAFQEGNRNGGLSREAIATSLASGDNQWTPQSKKAPYNKKMNFSVGDTLRFENGSRIGYLYGTSYSRKYQTTKRFEARYEAINPIATQVKTTTYISPLQNQELKKYNESVTLGNILNLAYEPKKGQEFYVKTLLSNQSDKYYQSGYGYNGLHEIGIVANSSGFTARQLQNITLGGNHLISPTANWRNHLFKWHYSTSNASRDQPDLKQEFWNVTGNTVLPTRFGGSPDGNRFFSTTEENMKTWDFKYEMPFNQWNGLKSKLKFGLLKMETEKNFNSKTYGYQNVGGVAALEDTYPVPGELNFSATRVWNGQMNFSENAGSPSAYVGRQDLNAKFIQVDMPVLSKLRFIGGFRQEDSFQKTKTSNPKDISNTSNYITSGCENQSSLAREYLVGQNICPSDNFGIGSIDTNDTLPSANLVYAHDKKTNIRMAYSETVTRPDLRDLSPFGFSAYYGADVTFGNTDLDRTYIHNYDLRYEKYFSPAEYLGIGAFYKNLSAPIEIVGLPVGGDVAFNYVNINASRAEIRGVELDGRVDFLRRFRLEGNLFFIKSKVEVMEWEDYALTKSGYVNPASLKAIYSPTNISRPLQGQSERVANLKIMYFIDKEKVSSIGLFYNYFSDRIQIVGTAGAPDVIQKGMGILDLVLATKIHGKYNLNFKANNITDAKFRSVQASPLLGTEYSYRSYREGVSYSFSFGYDF